MHPFRRLDEAPLGRLLARGTLRGQFGLIVPIVRTGPGDRDLSTEAYLGKETFRQRCRQADAAMGCRVSWPGDGTRMQSDAVRGQAEEIGHLGARKAPPRWNLMPSTLGITDHHLALAIVDLAVEVRFLGLLLTDDRELSRRGGIGLDPRGHVAPADLLGSIIETGLLGISIDPDVGDLALVPRPFPALAFGGGLFLGFHRQDGGRRSALNSRLNLTLPFLLASLYIRK